MSDSISKMYEDYEDYEYYCKENNQTPKPMHGDSNWIYDLYNFKHPEFKKGEKYSMAEKLQIGTFKK